MLQTAIALPYHLTKVDTLQAQVLHLNHVVDSLNKVSSTTTIGTGYFHDIIGIGFTCFVGLVAIIATIAGYVSWRTITIRFEQERREMQINFDNRIIVMENQFTSTLHQLRDQAEKNSIAYDSALNDLKQESLSLKNNFLQADVDINRAMCSINDDREFYVIALDWGLSAIPTMLELNYEKSLYNWVEFCEEISDKIDLETPDNKERIKNYENQFKKHFSNCLNILPKEYDERLKKINDKIMRVIYSE
ncbi:hypothetical protein SAMN05192574_107249 [Mucilaginibacter gossypiicola]|uniref:Uncharacterized protein n=1 Tax=Mucilaginibacter gossypiicola TaxID=551995 RepID=A0A1H8P685_9SPHI|nr:hypothetical protein [Mucilaginibacter gossypiicola]SEO37396.1 hypothetical protein SAMN05192574_107249 [Mucilaginibacter gossypiicola]